MPTRRIVVEYDGEVELSERGKRALDDWRAAVREIDKLETVRDNAKEIVQEDLDDCEAGTVDGEVVVTWTRSEQNRLDTARFKKDFGEEIYKSYCTPSPRRTFKVLE